MLCTAGRPFLGDTSCSSGWGVHQLCRPGDPTNSRAVHEDQNKTSWMSFMGALLKLALPLLEHRITKTQAGGRKTVWQPGPNTQHRCTCSVFRRADMQCDLWIPQTVLIVSFAPCGWVNVGFVHKVTSLKSPLSDWAGIRVQVLFYRADGESLEVMSETRAYLIGWGDVAT